MVSVTVVEFEPITMEGSTVGLLVPPVVCDVVKVIRDFAIVAGIPQFLSNVTTIWPEPATSSKSWANSMLSWPLPPADVLDKLISVTSTSALAFCEDNIPKAIIVAMTPIATSRASPKDVLILVFIYSYLLLRVTEAKSTTFELLFTGLRIVIN